jgi:Ca2+-binding RTX toxin-like protein
MRVLLVSVVVWCVVGVGAAIGVPGDLDATFGGGDGIVTTAFNGYSDYGHGVVVDAEGRIVVAGSSDNGGDLDFAVVRYLAASAPGSVSGVAGLSGDGVVGLSWVVPAVSRGAVVTDYVVEYSADGGVSWLVFADGTSASTAATVSGLLNGVSYVFRVSAVNSAGTGPVSVVSGEVVPWWAAPAGCTVVGTPGDDVLYGTSGDDHICGLGGDDRIYGRAGDDILDGGPGKDKVFGEKGKDTLYGRGGADVLKGGSGNDKLYGGGGKDTLYGHGGADVLKGGPGNDKLYGNSGRDKLHGQAGNDTLHGHAGDDTLYGDTGKDRLFGNTGNDYLYGSIGNDKLYGQGGRDKLFGEKGKDLLVGGAEKDMLDGGQCKDTAKAPGPDLLVSIETIVL